MKLFPVVIGGVLLLYLLLYSYGLQTVCVWLSTLNRSVWAPTNLLKQPECHMSMVASICLINELIYIYLCVC